MDVYTCKQPCFSFNKHSINGQLQTYARSYDIVIICHFSHDCVKHPQRSDFWIRHWFELLSSFSMPGTVNSMTGIGETESSSISGRLSSGSLVRIRSESELITGDMSERQSFTRTRTRETTVETELKVTQSALDVHIGCTPFVKDYSKLVHFWCTPCAQGCYLKFCRHCSP